MCWKAGLETDCLLKLGNEEKLLEICSFCTGNPCNRLQGDTWLVWGSSPGPMLSPNLVSLPIPPRCLLHSKALGTKADFPGHELPKHPPLTTQSSPFVISRRFHFLSSSSPQKDSGNFPYEDNEWSAIVWGTKVLALGLYIFLSKLRCWGEHACDDWLSLFFFC